MWLTLQNIKERIEIGILKAIKEWEVTKISRMGK